MSSWGCLFIEALVEHQRLLAIAEQITWLVTPYFGFPCRGVAFSGLALLLGWVKTALSSLAHVYLLRTSRSCWPWEDDLPY